MTKVYERFIHNSLSSYAEYILSNFISAYRKSYSYNHVLLRLTDNCKMSLDKTLLELVSWIFQRLLTVFLMIYLLQTFIIWFVRRCGDVCILIFQT